MAAPDGPCVLCGCSGGGEATKVPAFIAEECRDADDTSSEEEVYYDALLNELPVVADGRGGKGPDVSGDGGEGPGTGGDPSPDDGGGEFPTGDIEISEVEAAAADGSAPGDGAGAGSADGSREDGPAAHAEIEERAPDRTGTPPGGEGDGGEDGGPPSPDVETSVTGGDDSSIPPGGDGTGPGARAGVISQLESQVASLNFDLATAKSSLDELRLENRQLMGDRSRLREENERLVKRIERLEREGKLSTSNGGGSISIASGGADDVDGGTAEQDETEEIEQQSGTVSKGEEASVSIESNRREEDDADVDGDDYDSPDPLDDDDPFATWSASPKTRSSHSMVDSAQDQDSVQDQQSTSNCGGSIASGDADDIDGGTAEQEEIEEVEQAGSVPKEDEVSVSIESNRREENDAVVDEADCHDDPDDPFATWRPRG